MKVLNPNKPEPEEVKVAAEKPPTRVEKRALAKATRSVNNGIMTKMRKLVRVQQEAVLPTIKLTIIRADVQANKRKREREEAESSNATSSKRVNIDPIHRSIAATATTQENRQQLELELLRMKFQQLDRTLPLSNAERHSKCRQLKTMAWEKDTFELVGIDVLSPWLWQYIHSNAIEVNEDEDFGDDFLDSLAPKRFEDLTPVKKART